MNPILENLAGVSKLTDTVIAMDLLITAKSGVRNYALAVTEAATPEIKETLIKHLNEAIDMHERLTVYMIEHGQYFPWQVNEQIRVDLNNAHTAMNLPG